MPTLSDLTHRLPGAIQSAPQWISFLLVALIAINLAQLSWRLLSSGGESEIVPATAVTPKPSAQPRPRADLARQIAAAHLFGEPTVEAAEVSGSVDRQTTLPLKLLGIYATDKPEEGIAIINTGQEEKVFGIDDSIISGAVLRKVLPDRAVLERNGVLEALFLPKDEGVAFPESAPPPPTQVEQAPSNLRELRLQVLNNPRKLNDIVDFQPFEFDGKFVGYRLFPKSNEQLFTQLGIVAGDVVTRVNDVTIDQPEKGIAALRELAKAKEVTLVLDRAGSQIVVQRSLN